MKTSFGDNVFGEMVRGLIVRGLMVGGLMVKKKIECGMRNRDSARASL